MKTRKAIRLIGGLIERGEMTPEWCSPYALGVIATLCFLFSLDEVARMREMAFKFYRPQWGGVLNVG